jgi:hypothetical protein
MGLHVGARNIWVKKTRYFFRILSDKKFIFVSLSFKRAEINFDVSFIVRFINFSLHPPSLIIPYTNIKNFVFLFCISLKHGEEIRHVQTIIVKYPRTSKYLFFIITDECHIILSNIHSSVAGKRGRQLPTKEGKNAHGIQTERWNRYEHACMCINSNSI